MTRKTIKCPIGRTEMIECYVKVTCYATPFENPPRLMVQLLTTDEESQYGPIYGVASVNLPNMPAPPPRAFYMKTWTENQGLLEVLLQAGAVKVLDPVGVPVNQWGSKAPVVQLAWEDSDMEVDIPDTSTRQRAAEDTERFLSNTYVMHLGL